MSTYRAIASTEIDADSPLTVQLAEAWTNNTLAIAEADATAPSISAAAISRSGVNYTRTSSESLSTSTQLTWETRTNIGDHVDSTTTFTATKTGFHLLHARVRLSGTGYDVRMRLNGTTIATFNSPAPGTSTATAQAPFVTSAVDAVTGDQDDYHIGGAYYFTAGETIDFFAVTASGDLFVEGEFRLQSMLGAT